MKANELMIGDWVLDSTTKDPIQIDGACIKHAEYCEQYEQGDTCDPIEITGDILKENGFDINTLHYDDNNVIYYNPETRYLQIYSLILGQQKPKINIYIKYVHELQHVLRLCGMNEFADGFKIK